MATLAFKAEGVEISRLKALTGVLVLGCAPVATMLLTWLPPGVQAGTSLLLVKGFAVPFLIAELILIAIAWSCVEARRVEVTAPGWCKAAVLALLVIATGNVLFVAPAPIESAVRTAILAVHLLLGVSVYRLVSSRLVDLGSLTQALTTGFLLSLAALLLLAWEVRNLDSFNWMHELPGYVNIRNLGYYAAPMAALIVARLSLDQGFVQRLWNFSCAAAAIGLILWSGSRGAMVALALAYLATALLCPRLRSTTAWFPVLLACLVGGAAAHAIGSPMHGVGLASMAEREEFSSGRVDLWLSSVEAIRQRPWFGYGEGQTIHVVPFATYARIFSPHNIVLQTLLAWGAVGALLVLALGGEIARRVIFALRTQGGEFIPPALALVVTLVYSLIDSTLFYVVTTGVFAACLGAFLAKAPADRAGTANSW